VEGRKGNRRERINSMGKDVGNVWGCMRVIKEEEN